MHCAERVTGIERSNRNTGRRNSLRIEVPFFTETLNWLGPDRITEPSACLNGSVENRLAAAFGATIRRDFRLAPYAVYPAKWKRFEQALDDSSHTNWSALRERLSAKKLDILAASGSVTMAQIGG